MFRILYINSSPYYGGTEKWAITTASLLQKKGHQIWFACRFRNICQHAMNNKLTTIQLPLKNDFDMWSTFKLCKFISKNRIDAVIATKVREYWLGGIAAKLLSVPLIIRLGIRRNLNESVKNKLIYRYFMKAMIVNTNAIKETLLESKFIESRRIHVIYNGVDCPPALPETNQINDITNLVYVGYLSKRKNVRTIIQIFYKFQKEIDFKTIHLWIVGDGPERPELQEYVSELGIEDKVRFWGHRDDIPYLLEKSHIMLMLSESEGFPNAAMEAMARGVPLIISQFSGVKEFVSHGKTAFIVDPKNDDEILCYLKTLISDHDTYNQIRMQAYQLMKERYSLERMVEKADSLMRSILND